MDKWSNGSQRRPTIPFVVDLVCFNLPYNQPSLGRISGLNSVDCVFLCCVEIHRKLKFVYFSFVTLQFFFILLSVFYLSFLFSRIMTKAKLFRNGQKLFYEGKGRSVIVLKVGLILVGLSERNKPHISWQIAPNKNSDYSLSFFGKRKKYFSHFQWNF